MLDTEIQIMVDNAFQHIPEDKFIISKQKLDIFLHKLVEDIIGHDIIW